MAAGLRELVGRDEELASLLALLDARDGLPAVAVVTGEAGIGNTALWLASMREAGLAASGALLPAVRSGGAFSFSGWPT